MVAALVLHFCRDDHAKHGGEQRVSAFRRPGPPARPENPWRFTIPDSESRAAHLKKFLVIEIAPLATANPEKDWKDRLKPGRRSLDFSDGPGDVKRGVDHVCRIACITPQAKCRHGPSEWRSLGSSHRTSRRFSPQICPAANRWP